MEEQGRYRDRAAQLPWSEFGGADLTGATSVTFNGTAAEFTVVSKSETKTTVPGGATTGTVKVTTPKGTLKSNVVFRVTK